MLIHLKHISASYSMDMEVSDLTLAFRTSRSIIEVKHYHFSVFYRPPDSHDDRLR